MALFSRPVCPSGDGGVLESCCFSSPSDPSPYSTWPSISSASLAGERRDVRALNLTFPDMFLFSLIPSFYLCTDQGLCGHSALWEDQLGETTGKVGAVVPAAHADWYTEGKKRKKKEKSQLHKLTGDIYVPFKSIHDDDVIKNVHELKGLNLMYFCLPPSDVG